MLTGQLSAVAGDSGLAPPEVSLQLTALIAVSSTHPAACEEVMMEGHR